MSQEQERKEMRRKRDRYEFTISRKKCVCGGGSSLKGKFRRK